MPTRTASCPSIPCNQLWKVDAWQGLGCKRMLKLLAGPGNPTARTCAVRAGRESTAVAQLIARQRYVQIVNVWNDKHDQN